MTLDEANERIADLEARVAYMQREFDRTLAALADVTRYAELEPGTTAAEPEPVMGRLLHLPAARKNAKTGATGRTARSVTADAAPRRVSHLGNAS